MFWHTKIINNFILDAIADGSSLKSALRLLNPTPSYSWAKKQLRNDPELKAAYTDSDIYIGDAELKNLVALKSKNELIGDIIGLLQSPATNLISALQGNADKKIGSLVKALEEKAQA